MPDLLDVDSKAAKHQKIPASTGFQRNSYGGFSRLLVGHHQPITLNLRD